MGKFNFPKIENVIIKNFSLYSKNGEPVLINEKINNGVYCLAGANGLGKTTFLNAVNYGLTGIVVDPSKEVFSPEEILKENYRYTDKYFTGRIFEKDQDRAEIEISLRIRNKLYHFIRGFSDRDSIRELKIYEIRDKEHILVFNGQGNTHKELRLKYETELANDIGCGKIEYYFFLQLYVFTFDENKRLIFWDNKAFFHALNIVFNDGIISTTELTKIKRDMDKLESDGRNIRWQATQIKNKIKTLTKDSKNIDDKFDLAIIQNDYVEICAKHEQLVQEITGLNTEHVTYMNRQNKLYSEIVQLRIHQKKYFSLFSEPRSSLLNNSLIQRSLENCECIICSAKGSYIIENIRLNLNRDNCPLCNSSISESKMEEQDSCLQNIEEIDKLLYSKNLELEHLISQFEGKENKIKSLQDQLKELEVLKYDMENSAPAIKLSNKHDDSLNLLIQNYTEQYNELDKEAKNKYNQRDILRPKYDILKQRVEKNYKDAEQDFVPIFRKLASEFLGVDLNIYFAADKRDMKLNLEVKNTSRVNSFDLSESQRFFLDIALRMAISIWLANSGNECTLLIDTPEGSLDITYERNVGKMFSIFVIEYQQNILMTANINTSQLLVSLAQNCGNAYMRLRRMLDWTTLSDVQKSGEYLFDEALKIIEGNLNEK